MWIALTAAEALCVDDVPVTSVSELFRQVSANTQFRELFSPEAQQEELKQLRDEVKFLRTSLSQLSAANSQLQSQLAEVNSTTSATKQEIAIVWHAVSSVSSSVTSAEEKWESHKNDLWWSISQMNETKQCESCLQHQSPCNQSNVMKTCECAVNWSGPLCNDCAEGYFGSDCSICMADCSGHGMCNDGRSGNGSCRCDEGWTGTLCDECGEGYFGHNCSLCSLNCSGHGECHDGLFGDGSCACDEGWVGETCDECAAGFFGSECTPCNCSAHGTCSDGRSSSGSCSCEEKFFGSQCEIQKLQLPSVSWSKGGMHPGYISSQGSLVATAAMYSNVAATEAGALFMWRLNGNASSFEYLQTVVTDDASSYDWLGEGGPSLAEDGSIIVAGAHGEGSSGAAYVWKKNNSTGIFEQSQKLIAPNGNSGDWVGQGPVRMSADASMLAVGAWGDDDQGYRSGALHIWKWDDGVAQFQYFQKILTPDGEAEDFFGLGFKMLSDNGSTLVSMAQADDDAGLNAGALYVWKLDALSQRYDHQQKITAPDAEEIFLFDFTGAMSGDGTVLALGAHSTGKATSSVYIWERRSILEEFQMVQKLVVPDGMSQIGNSVSLSADGSTLVAKSEDSIQMWKKNGVLQGYRYEREFLPPESTALLALTSASLNRNASLLVSRADVDALYVWNL